MKFFSNHGGFGATLLLIVWLIFCFAGVVGYFLYREGYLRVDYGPPVTEEVLAGINANQIAELQKQEEIVDSKQRELRKQEDHINKLLEQFELQKRLLEQEREEISAHLVTIESFFNRFTQEEEADLKKLSRVYENMKAAKVATIFSELDIPTIAELLTRMNNRASAKILAEIGQQNAKRAAEISDVMQGKDKSEAFAQALQ